MLAIRSRLFHRPALLIAALVTISFALAMWQAARPAGTTGLQPSVSAGWDHTCAMTTEGGVLCWGRNEAGELGDNTTADSNTPVEVCAPAGCATNLSGIAMVSAGRNHTCAVTETGAAKCWGLNALGELGTGDNMNRELPADVSGLSSGGVDISSGRYHTCAIVAAGRVQCWGTNFYGQLGNGTDGNQTNASVDVCADAGCESSLANIIAIASGRYHVCVAPTAGGVKCWGDNPSGELGNGSVTPTNYPVDVCGNDVCATGLGSVVDVGVGMHHSCALTNAGGVSCWGANESGQLGDGTNAPSNYPVNVSGLTSGVIALAVSDFHACAVMGTGVLKCWGMNDGGQLGDGTTTNRNAPVDVCADDDCLDDLSGVASASTGFGHTCAVLQSGVVHCWGNNTFGQLGDGSTTNSSVPVDVSLPGGLGTPKPTATPTQTPTATSTASPTATPTATSVATATATRTATVVPSATATATRTSTATPTLTPTAAVLIGDVNCDGHVDSIDAALVLQYGAGLLTTLACPEAADVNGDGAINSIDAALILQFVAGLLDEP